MSYDLYGTSVILHLKPWQRLALNFSLLPSEVLKTLMNLNTIIL